MDPAAMQATGSGGECCCRDGYRLLRPGSEAHGCISGAETRWPIGRRQGEEGRGGGGPARRPIPDTESSIVASSLFKLLPVFSLGGLQTSLSGVG